ncbi:Angiogenic factor with G patch and FHA domains 1 [Sarcoptes scabiei]|nr:Angiogenic factor with G patch and FHA domains 1 [Sarcoptes scabiei]
MFKKETFFTHNQILCDKWLKKYGFSGFKHDLVSLESEMEEFKMESQQRISNEIDETYLQAMRTNSKHQTERNKAKKTMRNNQNWLNMTLTESFTPQSKESDCLLVSRMEILETKTNQNVPNSALHFDEEKSLELKLLESQLQENFDNFCDHFQPNLWPLLPVKIRFKTS